MVTDKRTHRGKAPQDERYFSEAAMPMLARAIRDLSWLLSRGYAEKSSLKLVCDHYLLTKRQRLAVMRCSCSDESLRERRHRRLATERIAGRKLLVDGYNVITTVETALGGGVVLIGRDGCYRDISGVHGTYRKVEETVPAVRLIGASFAEVGASAYHWYLDSPVSNSGRLRAVLLDMAARNGWCWDVDLAADPDKILADTQEVIATSDGVVLERCGGWINLLGHIIRSHIPEAFVLDFSEETLARDV